MLNTIQHASNNITDTAVLTFKTGSPQSRSEQIIKITKNPEIYNPPALYALSEALFKKFKDEEALFWHLAAKLRSNQDYQSCKRLEDSFGSSLMFFSSKADLYLKLEPEKSKAIAQKVVDWDRATPVKYNIQWGKSKSECMSVDRQKAEREKIRARFAESLQPHTPSRIIKKSMDELKPIAESGEKKAQLELGICYMNSFSCEAPLEDIQEKFDYQARQELDQQYKTTGSRYSGKNTRREYEEKGIAWLSKSASQGETLAMMQLASYYGTKEGRELFARDEKKSCSYLMEMIRMGNSRAYTLMPQMAWHQPPQKMGPAPGNYRINTYAWHLTAQKASTDPDAYMPILNQQASGLSDSELSMAKKWGEFYTQEYVKSSKPLCQE